MSLTDNEIRQAKELGLKIEDDQIILDKSDKDFTLEVESLKSVRFPRLTPEEWKERREQIRRIELTQMILNRR